MDQFFFIMQRDALLMYHKFDKSYKNQPLLLAKVAALKKKIVKKVGHNKQISRELRISFRTKF